MQQTSELAVRAKRAARFESAKDSTSLLTPVSRLRIEALPAFTAPSCQVQTFLKMQAPLIYYANTDVAKWFGGKVEGPAAQRELTLFSLNSKTSESRIFQEAADRPTISFSQFLALLEVGLKGEKTGLLQSGWPNIFHCLDKDGVVRSLHARWYIDQPRWNVMAYQTDYAVECIPKGYVAMCDL